MSSSSLILCSSSSVEFLFSSWKRHWASTLVKVGWLPGGRSAPCSRVNAHTKMSHSSINTFKYPWKEVCDCFLQGSEWHLRWSWPTWTSTTSWCWPGPSSTWSTPSKAHFLGLHVTMCGTPVRAAAPARFEFLHEVCYKFSPPPPPLHPPPPRVLSRWRRHLRQPSSIQLQLVLFEQHHHRKLHWWSKLFVCRSLLETMLTNLFVLASTEAHLCFYVLFRHSNPLSKCN